MSTVSTGSGCGTSYTVSTNEAVSSDPQAQKEYDNRAIYADKQPDQRIKQYVASVDVLNSNVVPNMRVLLGEMLRLVDASIPNKDQNRSMKEILRASFDRAYFSIYTHAFPDCNYQSGAGYALEPAANHFEAFTLYPLTK